MATVSGRSTTKLYEFEGKRLFARAGIQIPRGRVVGTIEETAGLIAEYGSVMVKAQTLWGKRARHHAVVACENEEQLEAVVRSLLGKDLQDEKIEKLLVEEKLPIAAEAYLALTYEGRKPVAIVSRHGGIGIEQIRRETPDDVIVQPINILRGLSFDTAENVVRRAGFGATRGLGEIEHVASILLRLYRMFIADDALLAEINPLIGTADGDWLAADAKVEIDEDALYRQAHLRLPERLPSGRVPTKLETLALKNDHMDTRGSAGRMFYELPGGNIVVLASGGGTSIEALDDLCLLGGQPAIFTEYSGNPSAEKVAGLTKIALMYPGPVDGIWVVGGRANFTDIYETLVNGVMAGIRETGNFDKSIPIIIRRAGPRDNEAFDALRHLREREGYNIFLRGVATSVGNSARMLIHHTKMHAERKGRGTR